MAGYLCKDPDCVDTVAWHLIHGNMDCLADNREEIAAYVIAAEANMPRPDVRVNLHLTCSGYEDQSATIILPGLPSVDSPVEIEWETPAPVEPVPEPEPAPEAPPMDM